MGAQLVKKIKCSERERERPGLNQRGGAGGRRGRTPDPPRVSRLPPLHPLDRGVRFARPGAACASPVEAAGAEFAIGLAPPPTDWNSPLLIEGERRRQNGQWWSSSRSLCLSRSSRPRPRRRRPAPRPAAPAASAAAPPAATSATDPPGPPNPAPPRPPRRHAKSSPPRRRPRRLRSNTKVSLQLLILCHEDFGDLFAYL